VLTLTQYPWYMVDYITIEDRNLLFKATKELLQLLVDRVHNEKDNINLTPMLLKRAWRAALRCPGFTPAQKDDIVCICSVDDRTAKELGVAPHASYWKILWCIGPKPGVPEDLLLASNPINHIFEPRLTPSVVLCNHPRSNREQAGATLTGRARCSRRRQGL